MSNLLAPQQSGNDLPSKVDQLNQFGFDVWTLLQGDLARSDDSIDGMRTRIAALEAKLAAMAAIVTVAISFSDPVAGSQGQALQAAINQILNAAKGTDNGTS